MQHWKFQLICLHCVCQVVSLISLSSLRMQECATTIPSHARPSACRGWVRYPQRHHLEAENNRPHLTHEAWRGEDVSISRAALTSMETVLSWSLLMAFPAAVTVFTISLCFCLSSFCENKSRTNVRTSKSDPLAYVNAQGVSWQHTCCCLCCTTCGRVVSGIPQAGPGDSEQQLLQVQTLTERFCCSRQSMTESDNQTFLFPPKISLTRSKAGTPLGGHRCLGSASGGRVRLLWCSLVDDSSSRTDVWADSWFWWTCFRSSKRLRHFTHYQVFPVICLKWGWRRKLSHVKWSRLQTCG